MPMLPPGKKKLWEERLTRSAFLLSAILFHLIVFLSVATWVVFKPAPLPPDEPHRFIPPVAAVPPPPPPTVSPVAPAINPNVSLPVVRPAPSNLHFTIHEEPVGLTGPEPPAPPPPSTPPTTTGPLAPRLRRIHDTVLKYRTQEEIVNHDPTATFPVYVAAYADGDWACNIHLDRNGNIIAGSIPDLVAKINEWSHGHIKGEVVPKPLDIGSPELLNQMPPFIFFTGHKDFVLTDQEIVNLRNYLQSGGAIWGDNALAGRGSRFDAAFHREMKRVVPDPDKPFKPVPMDADLFTKSRFVISEIPKGMNYYAEPLEHLDIDDKLAILYTPNDYSDLCAMRILPGDTQIQAAWPDLKSQSPLFTSGIFLGNRNLFFRNFTLESSIAAHRLGMNIVVYLLTRFDDELLLSP